MWSLAAASALESVELESPYTITRSGGMHHSGSTSPHRPKRGMKSDKPVKCPVWQTDECEILLSKNGVHAWKKILSKTIIFLIELIYEGFDPAI